MLDRPAPGCDNYDQVHSGGPRKDNLPQRNLVTPLARKNQEPQQLLIIRHAGMQKTSLVYSYCLLYGVFAAIVGLSYPCT